MKKTLTEIVYILDRSGSMSGLESDTIGGFNSMIEKQKETGEKAYVSTVLFDDRTEVIHDRVPIEKVDKITNKEYFVRGSTALLDAVGGAIKHIINIHKYAREEDRPDKTIFVITTDGMENASRTYTYPKVKKLIENQKEKHGWEFMFLAANIDAVNVASYMGIDESRAVNFNCDSEGTELNYEVLNDAIGVLRECSYVSKDWKQRIDKDFKKRGNTRNK